MRRERSRNGKGRGAKTHATHRSADNGYNTERPPGHGSHRLGCHSADRVLIAPCIDAPSDTARVLATLSESDLLPEQRLAAVSANAADHLRSPGAELLERLIESGELTTWQAGQILAGGSRFDLGRFRLLERIGGGGMGTVFRARHTVMQRDVAIKVIRRDLLNAPNATRRFEREIRAAAKLDHPGIVRALDADEILGVPVLSMELIDGVDFERWLRAGGALPTPWACEVTRQALEALQHAYESGLVHRDLKTRKSRPRSRELSSHVASSHPRFRIGAIQRARR